MQPTPMAMAEKRLGCFPEDDSIKAIISTYKISLIKSGKFPKGLPRVSC
jgi:hypothetical protein